MTPDEQQRYRRHLALAQLGPAGQAKLLDAHALIIGVGGLGSPVASYLAAAGVGTLTLVDPDRVELSNLQRQIIHTTPGLGQAKVTSAAARIHALNPAIKVNPIAAALDESALAVQVSAADIILDCSDNLATRLAVNQACYAQARPLISGAVTRWEGQLFNVDPSQPAAACYRCLYAESPAAASEPSQAGIVAPLPGVIGSLQALEAIKGLAGLASPAGQLYLFDTDSLAWQTIHVPKRTDCPVCGAP